MTRHPPLSGHLARGLCASCSGGVRLAARPCCWPASPPASTSCSSLPRCAASCRATPSTGTTLLEGADDAGWPYGGEILVDWHGPAPLARWRKAALSAAPAAQAASPWPGSARRRSYALGDRSADQLAVLDPRHDSPTARRQAAASRRRRHREGEGKPAHYIVEDSGRPALPGLVPTARSTCIIVRFADEDIERDAAPAGLWPCGHGAGAEAALLSGPNRRASLGPLEAALDERWRMQRLEMARGRHRPRPTPRASANSTCPARGRP